MKQQAAKLQTEITRLAAALASTDEQPGSVIRRLVDKERQLTQVQAQLAAGAVVQTVDSELQRLEREAERRLANISADFGQNLPETKAMLTRLLAGERLRLTPETCGIRIRGPLSLWDHDCGASPGRFAPV